MDVIEIITKHSLTVRCLPYEVVSKWTYREGQKLKENQELVYWKPDIDYFKNLKILDLRTARNRMKDFYKRFPDGKPVVKETRLVKKGGWFYVKETKNTDSTVRFNRDFDKFFAPTLEEAIKLFLKEKEVQNV
jgi:hypothetical protein